MKKNIKILLILLLITPITINARILESAINYSNNYIINLKDYDRYIVNTKLFDLDLDVLKQTKEHNYGGFISKTEYILSQKYHNNYISTYLFDGTNYWTLTKEEDINYTVDINGFESSNDTSGIKTTTYIKNNVEVKGTGSRSNPYTFLKQNIVTIQTNNEIYGTFGKVKLINKNNKNEIITTESNLSNISLEVTHGKNAIVTLEPKEGYKYLSSTCDNTRIENDGKLFLISNIKSDITCKINYGRNIYKISLDKNCKDGIDGTNEVYLNYGETWYYSHNLKEIVKNIKVPICNGYNFLGYKTMDNKLIINNVGEILGGNTEYFTSDTTIYGIWQ